MAAIVAIAGQPCYTLESDRARAAVTVQGGHMTAAFSMGKRWVEPFFTAPWWNEAVAVGTPDVLRVLRGDFFCFPFGSGDPLHGKTSNACWEPAQAGPPGSSREIVLAMDLDPLPGRVEKRIRVADGEPVLYISHTISGFSGEMPLGHHPILQLPGKEASGFLDMSTPVAGFTTLSPIESPGDGGYSRIASGREIADRARVPTADGSTVDLTRYPTPKGFEDLVCFICDQRRDFCFSAVSVPEAGYLYFQLKDPRLLAETVLWMSNGGRHYPPWNGRISSVLGLEEVTGFYHYGQEASRGANAFRDRGFATTVSLKPDTPTRIPFIVGAVPIGADFKGVEDIVAKDGERITIRGRGGESIDVRCRVDALRS